MTKWTPHLLRVLQGACIMYVAVVAPAGAATTAEEAGPKATPKIIACMAACEQAQMACLQGPSGVPPERRTIKDINAFRSCNQTEERCDHRCRHSK
jgi:hypothetical protein